MNRQTYYDAPDLVLTPLPSLNPFRQKCKVLCTQPATILNLP